MARKTKRPVTKGQETRAITEAEYSEIIRVMREGKPGFFKPNEKAAMALVLEANLGIRISDITGIPATEDSPGTIGLRLCDIIRDGDRWRLSITEQKTGKPRYFTVPDDVRAYIVDYCYQNGIGQTEPIVGIKRRSVQDALKKVTDFLGMERVGTHSFRKFFATKIYEDNDHDVALVREILQHTSLETTQRYLRVSSERVDLALKGNTNLI
ncbi:MAG: tyrosine-type recombinase/integrase [Bacteroidaceae bacterium]|nr:tyrosine-type recombinase/integrase [Bacteroidaceae bacterium]